MRAAVAVGGREVRLKLRAKRPPRKHLGRECDIAKVRFSVECQDCTNIVKGPGAEVREMLKELGGFRRPRAHVAAATVAHKGAGDGCRGGVLMRGEPQG